MEIQEKQWHICKSSEHTQDAICTTGNLVFAALQMYGSSSCGCICGLVLFLLLKEAPQFGEIIKKRKKEKKRGLSLHNHNGRQMAKTCEVSE